MKKLLSLIIILLFNIIVYSQNTIYIKETKPVGTFQKTNNNENYTIQKATVYTELQGNEVKQVVTYKVQDNSNQIERLPKIQKTTKNIINPSPYKLKKDEKN